MLSLSGLAGSESANGRAEYDRFISQLVHRFVVIALSGEVLEEAADLTQRHPLKAYDAVQLAVALRQNRALATVRQSLIFVSGDKTLLTAAKAEGLAIDNPFDHVSPQDTPTALESDIPEASASRSIHLAMAADADQDDVLLPQLQLKGNPILQVDRR